MTVVQLDVEDLARIDEEITNWQIHNSFTSSTTAFPTAGGVHAGSSNVDGSFVAPKQKFEDPQFKPISFIPVQTPVPLTNTGYSFHRGNEVHSPLYGREEDRGIGSDPFGLYANNVIENAIYATPLRSELEHQAGIPQEILHCHEDGVSVNHQLELEQMAAIAGLSIDGEEQDSFITQSALQKSLAYANNEDREADTFAEHVNKMATEADFPVVEPPAPLITTPPHELHDQDSDQKLMLLIDEIERLKEEKIQMKKLFEAEKQRMQTHFAKQGIALASLKSQIEKEGQIDLIQLKREILQQKETQLESIRQEMKVEREHIEMQMQEQLLVKQQEWALEKQDLVSQIESLQQENNQLNQVPIDMASTKQVSEAVCQTDDVCSSSPHVQISKLRQLNAELEEKQTDMLMLLSKQETVISEKTDEIVNIRDEMANLQRKCADFEMKLATYKRRSIPDPFTCISMNVENGFIEEEKDNQKASDEVEIEQRYSKAYETAVEHLKESYAAMTAKLKAKTEKAHNEAVIRVRKELEKVLQGKESALLKERSQSIALNV